jgi:ABC-2 type transport system permease protein
MTAFLALVRKDLKVFARDRRAVIMAFVAPILIGSFFGYVFGPQVAREQTALRVLFADEDRSAVAGTLLANLRKEGTFEVAESSSDAAREAVKKGKTPVALLLPKGFGGQATQALLAGGAKPQITVLFDPLHHLEAGMFRGLLTGQVMQAITKNAFAGGGGSGFTIPFETKGETITAGRGVAYNAYAHSFGGMAIQFMLFMGIDVGIGMLLLRQRGLWRRFRAAPLSKAVLLGSRAFSAMLVGMLILTVVFTFARIVFDVRIEGSLAGFIGVCAAFSLMTACYGLLIAALGKTAEASRALAILGTLVMVMLSGAWVPSFIFPPWMQSVTKAIPARWAMDGIDAMTWRGLGFEEALLPIGVLLGSAVVFGAIAVWRFRWEAE